MMKRALSILIDAGLFLITLLAWGIIAALGAGFLEIAFTWKVFSSTAGLIVLAVVVLLGAGFLSIAGPKVVFGQTPGESLMFRKKAPGARPAIYWFAWLGILAGLYLAMWLGSALILGAMARKQEAVVRSLGVPDDWRDAFPEFEEDDNAAFLLRLAGDSLKTSDPLSKEAGISWAFKAVTEKPDSAAAAWPVADRLLALNAKPLAWFDQASRNGKLMWHDYRSLQVDSLLTAPHPNYAAMHNLSKLSMMQAAMAVRDGRHGEAAAAIDRTTRILKLLMAERTLIGKMVGLAQIGIISNGLAAISRANPRAYPLIKAAYDSMTIAEGQTLQGTVNEISVIENIIWPGRGGRSFLSLGSRLRGELDGGSRFIWGLFGVALYRVWEPWDHYCYLKASEINLRAVEPKNGGGALAEYEKQAKAFQSKRQRLPALFTSIVMPDLASMYKRELEARAKPANALLFAAALNCRRERGAWPKDLAALVPGYFPELPQNPVDGEHYIYILTNDRMEVRGNDSKGEALLKSTVCKF